MIEAKIILLLILFLISHFLECLCKTEGCKGKWTSQHRLDWSRTHDWCYFWLSFGEDEVTRLQSCFGYRLEWMLQTYRYRH